MKVSQAQHIIQTYSKLLSDVSEKKLFMPRSILPCSNAMIKYAFYTYVDELVRMSRMNISMAESLIVAYAHLSFFVEDEQAEALNQIAQKKYQDKRDRATIKLLEDNHAMLKTLSQKKDTMVRELSEYIRDCVQVARN